MARTYQLASLADLFAFRFRSRWVGTLITGVSLLAVLPLLALQIQTLGDAIQRMTGVSSPALVTLLLCALVALFAMAFGDHQGRGQARHDPLLAIIALKALIKRIAILPLWCSTVFCVRYGVRMRVVTQQSDVSAGELGIRHLLLYMLCLMFT